ncbi:MAG: hypothetical protein ACE5IM_13655, partial [Nitrospinota bacterium]
MKRFWAILIAGVLLAWVPAATLANGDEHHEEELAEPLFTNKAFLENEITIEVEFENKETVDETALAFTGSWIILPRLQVGMEIPVGFRDPEVGESTHDLSDIEFSGKFLIPHPLEERLILSTGFDLAVPSGDGDKQIGGKGEWALSVNAGTAIPLSNLGGEFAGAPDLGVHFEFGYAQQIQLTDPQVAEAKELGVEDVLEKEVIWRLAFNSQLF